MAVGEAEAGLGGGGIMAAREAEVGLGTGIMAGGAG